MTRAVTVLVLLWAYALGSSGWASPAVAASICQEGTVRDFAAPLRAMPHLRPPPRDQLPFGPRGIEFTHRLGSPVILQGASEFGYELARSRTRNAGHPIFVSWLVTAKLARVDRRGETREKLGWRREHVSHIGRDDPTHLTFRQPLDEPGFYRLEIAFRNRGGKLLGRFGEYIRILKPSFDARLSLDQASFKPGDVISPRLENYGAAYLFFGLLGAYYERYDGTTWSFASFGNGPKIAIGIGMGPGESAACWGVQIPEDTSAGRYRFRLELDYGLGRAPRERRTAVNSEFDITG